MQSSCSKILCCNVSINFLVELEVFSFSKRNLVGFFLLLSPSLVITRSSICFFVEDKLLYARDLESFSKNPGEIATAARGVFSLDLILFIVGKDIRELLSIAW